MELVLLKDLLVTEMPNQVKMKQLVDFKSNFLNLSNIDIKKNQTKVVVNKVLTEDNIKINLDENATLIDATGVTKATDQIKFANPNCLYIANEGILANESNVLIADENGGYICANLVLETGKAFRAPFDFTANLASMTKTVTEGGFATLVLPYAVNNVTAGKVYELTDVNGTVVNGDLITTIEANQPVLLNAGNYELKASNVTIEANPASMTNGALTGVYDATTVIPEGSYVLQNQSGQTGFYKVEAGSEPTIGAYRAYLNADVVAAGVNVRLILLDDDSATGIDAVQNDKDAAVNVYNLNGILVRENVKASEALNGLQRGIYIVNGTKKVVK